MNYRIMLMYCWYVWTTHKPQCQIELRGSTGSLGERGTSMIHDDGGWLSVLSFSGYVRSVLKLASLCHWNYHPGNFVWLVEGSTLSAINCPKWVGNHEKIVQLSTLYQTGLEGKPNCHCEVIVVLGNFVDCSRKSNLNFKYSAEVEATLNAIPQKLQQKYRV